jgi:hypothetical protein
VPDFELPERELELAAQVAREILVIDQLVRDLYALCSRLARQRDELRKLEAQLRAHTAPKEQQP